MSEGPDYRGYSSTELLEAYEGINKERFPERFQELAGIMQEQGLLIRTEGTFALTEKACATMQPLIVEDDPVLSYTSLPPAPEYDKEGNYIPNVIPPNKRLANIFLSLAIIVYGGYGLYSNELWVPLNRWSSIVLSGVSAIVMVAAIVCASIMMIAEVVDHYDKRDNEHSYYKTALIFKFSAYVAFGIAVTVGLFTGAPVK